MTLREANAKIHKRLKSTMKTEKKKNTIKAHNN